MGSWVPCILCCRGAACWLLVLLSLFRLEDPGPAVVDCVGVQSSSVVWVGVGSFVLQLVHTWQKKY